MKPSDYIKRGWCQNTAARDRDGKYCSPTSIDATQWCIYGAIDAAYPTNTREPSPKFEDVADKIRAVLTRPISVWNDDTNRTQREVIDLLESVGE